MDLKYIGACRGDGLIYAKLEVSAELSIEEIAVNASTGEGGALPCRWYEVDAPATDATARSIVAVLPLLEKGLQVVTVTATLAAGQCEEASTKLSMTRAKWESRFNYRLRSGLTDEIRDIEKQDVYDHVNIWLEEAIRVDGADELIVHAGAWTHGRENVELAYSVIDEDGETRDLHPILMGKERRAYALDPCFPVDCELLSFRMPASTRSLTLVARDVNDSTLWGFMSFEAARFAEALAFGDEMRARADADPGYHEWFLDNRIDQCLLAQQRRSDFGHAVIFSIVVPLFRTPVALFREMADSVLAQSYGRWELVLVNATPEDAELAAEIEAYRARDGRIRCIELAGNLGIVGNTNTGIEQATGDYVCFLDHDDVIEPNTLFEYARVIDEKLETGMLYCDEDKLLASGRFANPFFKSDFNIDLLRSHNYICHFLCVRASLLREVGLSEDRHNGAQDHDIALKCAEHTTAIEHVRKVLYHWRVIEGSTAAAAENGPEPKGYANDAGAEAIRDHLARLGLAAEVEPTRWAYAHHVRYLVEGEPLVSIVIPNKDCAEMLDDCIRSIVEKTTYSAYEIVVVENNSTEQATFDYYDRLGERYPQARVVRWPHEFNFSKIVNFGAAESSGEYLLFLNNDTEVIEPCWLENMLGVCQRTDVGVVGAKLLYRDGTLQHAGVIMGDSDGVAYHVYNKLPEEYPGYFLQAGLTMDYSAVTGACMLTKRSVFDEVGGFDEELAVAFNDVDYCLKVRATGRLVVYEPSARLHHFESISRGYDLASKAKYERLVSEGGIMYHRWAEYFVNGDPYYSPSLSGFYYRLGKKD